MCLTSCVFRDLGGPALSPDIKKDINMFQLEGYAQHYFRTVKKGLFKRTVPGDINGGLLKHAKRDTHKAAIKMFRNIQRYMGDREVKAGNRSGDQLALHIAVEADRVPELRDEVYIQICKQTTQNPSPKSNGLGWELLAIISSICYPTKDLEVHLVAYLNFYLGWNEENVRAIAHYCLRKLGQKGRPASLHRAITLQEIVRYKAAPFQKSWFGSCLQEQLEMPVQAPLPQTAAADIPLILPALTDAIEVAGGFKTEGLFRISGDGAEVSRLRAQVEGGDLTFNPRACPHDLASLFKAWLRELTPVVIVPELYQEFLNNCDQQAKLRELVAHLPPVHNKALTHADNVPATKMTASNIALLFSPLLLSDDPMVMLENTKSESKAVVTLLQIDWSAS
ncbi:RhoGAP domain containing protein [Acanthamoeba castellanii str. Neff]|uniref:RhoGAP domain containing protein n=1 Tax=Acanthamoeba castellanii (strain ATCC 30010 / Neff) TaxID=1257118 RepID=L8GME9_ACACF|nr:RhoGAP domain containing protein [Acanthamoeba castellanii str. Neff]ELR13396.1 RhoGAP domain containing protein [Acanthamoeba castellanii str. Neff]